MEDNEKRTIIERLDAGECIIGDGGYLAMMERRGYVTAGQWTPECVLEFPDAVTQAHTDFALCGSDILQSFVFNGTDDNLNFARRQEGEPLLNVDEINDAGCRLVTNVAKKYNTMIAYGLSTTKSFEEGKGKDAVQKEFQKQVEILAKNKSDLLIAEFIGHVEEAEWAIEVMKETNIPVAITMCIGPLGDFNNVSVEDVAIRLAKAGADIIGVNCRFEPDTVVDTTLRMKKAVEEAGLKCHYMCQPCGYRTADAGRTGFADLPECPLAFESRFISRWDAQKYARKAYDAGIRYIGGCCGFEPYHIRACAQENSSKNGVTENFACWTFSMCSAERFCLLDFSKNKSGSLAACELREERGRLPINSRCLEADTLKYHHHKKVAEERSNKSYWMNLLPRDGRKPITSEQ